MILLNILEFTLKVEIVGDFHINVCPVSIFPVSYKSQTH